MNHFWQDAKYGIRILLKQPTFTIIALLTLALGIGMNTAIFSVLNAIMLRPLPMPDPEELVVVSSTVKRENLERRSTSYPDFLDWNKQNPVFQSMSVQADTTFTLNEHGIAERIEGEFISSTYFSLLGVRAIYGRTFLQEEDRTGAAVGVISYDLWQRRFSSDQELVGKHIRLDNQPVQIVGILPRGFYGLDDDTEVWVPISALAYFAPRGYLENRGTRWLDVFARLKKGVTIEQAQAAMDSITSRLQKEYPANNRDYGAMIIGFTEDLVGETKSAVLMLFGSVLFVLLISCTNVANLMLVRTAGRRKELAVRTALGASRTRMLQQLLTESLVLSVLGGLLGTLLGVWCTHLIARFSPVDLPSYMQTKMDLSVILFVIAATIFTGLLIGFIAAFQIASRDPHASLKDASVQSTDTKSTKSMKSILVICETALALVLLIGAGLMIRSLKELQSVPLGFQKERLLTMLLSLPAEKYAEEKGFVIRKTLVEKVYELPQVKFASLASDIPFGDSSSASTVTLEGTDPPQTKRVYRHRVSNDFFKTMEIPIIKGRHFDNSDHQESTPVVVVSRKMAERFWPNQECLGKQLKFGGPDSENPWMTVIGMAGDAKHRTLVENPLEEPDDPDFYLSLNQYGESDPVLILRTTGQESSIAEAVRKQIQMLDPAIPVYSINTMNDLVSRQTARSRFSTFLMSIFGILALLLACIGLYGVLSYAVTQRTREIGLRIALGANRKDVFAMILRQAFFWMACGLTAGIIGAVVLSRLLTNQLYQISSTDPSTYSMITIILLAVAFVATCIPARRATRVDPIVALRYE